MTTTTVFTNNRSQAVRLPLELRLPEGVRKVRVRALGNDSWRIRFAVANSIIAPADHTWDSFFLGGPKVSEDFLPERASQSQPEREPL